MSSASLTTLDAILKVKYGPAMINLINEETVVLSEIKKQMKDFKGKNYTQPKIMSLGGGIGARAGAAPTLPTAGTTVQADLIATCKKLYARVDIDREAIVAGLKSEQVFVDSTKHEMKAKATRFALDLTRQIYGDCYGSLGQLNADPGTATSFVVSAATFVGMGCNFMEGDRIYFYSDNAGVPNALRSGGVRTITAIEPSTRTITVDAALDAALDAADHVVLEGNLSNEITGLKLHVDAQTGTVHNIVKGTYFRARGIYSDASSAAVSLDLLNQQVEKMVSLSAEYPKMIITSPYQWRILQQLMDNAKVYYTSDDKKGRMGFAALEYISPIGPMPIYADRFCPTEKLYMLNPSSFSLIMRQDFGWFDEDGTILMRNANTDSYEARYGGYVELICLNDNSNGVVDNLLI